MIRRPIPRPAPAEPVWMGWLFIGLGSCILAFGWIIGICNLFSARFITQRRRRLFSLILAGVNCLSMPIGTVLGIFTIVVLSRPSVRAQYDAAAAAR